MRKTMLLTAMAAMVVAYGGAAIAASVVDQQQTNSSNSFVVSQQQIVAQTFTAGIDGDLDKVSVAVEKLVESGAPPPGEVIAKIESIDDAGKPSGTVLGSGTAPAGSFPDGVFGVLNPSPAWVDIPLTQPAKVSADTKYALVLYAPQATSDQPFSQYSWYTGADDYSRGDVWIDPLLEDGWLDNAIYNDMAFKTYVLPAAPPYDFTGFYSPVDNLPTFNKAKAGSAIPVKFSLGGDRGLDVFAKDATANATTSPTSGALACDSAAEIDPIETTVSAGSSGLSYDAASDTYTYVWKTQKGWTGCRQLVVEFDDGTVERANFRFVR
jgi:hypothetical protein